jgi:HK97 family phage portal protein
VRDNRKLVVPWEDLAVLRKDYVFGDIGGESNEPLLKTLDVIETMDKGLQNAVKSTANLRGILKSTKAMLSPETLKRQKDDFVRDYMDISNEGGIASLDATQEFIPVTMNPSVTDANTLKQIREDLYRYFGVNEKILTSDYNEEDMEAFYQSKIEPFLIALSEEMTRKVFTRREQDLGNAIIYESNRMGYSSNKTKLNMVQLVDRGILSPNELRQMFNMAPYEGGDEYIRRLDTMPTGTEAPDESKEE